MTGRPGLCRQELGWNNFVILEADGVVKSVGISDRVSVL